MKSQLTLLRQIISVCICTFNRPEMLSHALDAVNSQVTDNQFSFEVVVVDNDRMRSAEAVVRRFQKETGMNIVYDCEPEQSISLARNRAIRNARGDFIAFMDDDEIPVKDWLYRLYRTLTEIDADGALGPVLPFYPDEAPQWLKKGKVYDRRRFPTGTRLSVRDTRTGNVLLSKSVLSGSSVWFHPAFGRTGGEDVDFFRKQIEKGRVFVWCDEAVAYETVPPERWTGSFHIRRYFRSGTLNGEFLRKKIGSGLIVFLKNVVALSIWFLAFLVNLPLGKHRWFRPVLKLAYLGGCVLAFCGFSYLRDRK